MNTNTLKGHKTLTLELWTPRDATDYPDRFVLRLDLAGAWRLRHRLTGYDAWKQLDEDLKAAEYDDEGRGTFYVVGPDGEARPVAVRGLTLRVDESGGVEHDATPHRSVEAWWWAHSDAYGKLETLMLGLEEIEAVIAELTAQPA